MVHVEGAAILGMLVDQDQLQLMMVPQY